LYITMELLQKDCRVLWITRQCFWNVEKTFVLLVLKTLTLFGVGVHCLLQWNCLKETVFLKRIENVWSCLCHVSPLTSLRLHPNARKDQVVWRREYSECLRRIVIKYHCDYIQ
jgi:hypothetical protein